MSDWKQHHATEAERVLESSLVQDVMDEFAGNMGFEREGLPGYGLTKVVCYAAAVARAQALGFDPELLRVSDEEADEALLRLAQMAVEAGKPVWVLKSEPSSEEQDS